MARWRLQAPHYLNTDPPEIWEQVETDQQTGRQGRKQYHVPKYLHPEDQSKWTDRANGWIVVTDKKSPQWPTDILFMGPPGPDMMPLDDEATKISEGFKLRGEWRHPIDELPDTGVTYADKVVEVLAKEMAILNSTAKTVSNVGSDALVNELKDTVRRQEKMIADMLVIVSKKVA